MSKLRFGAPGQDRSDEKPLRYMRTEDGSTYTSHLLRLDLALIAEQIHLAVDKLPNTGLCYGHVG